MSAEARLRELGLELPEPPLPLGAYLPAMEAGPLLFLSGHLPMIHGNLAFTGRIGDDVTVEMAEQAAVLAALNVLARLRSYLGGFERLVHIARVDGHIACVDDFFGHAEVLDHASRLFSSVLKEKAGHARTIHCARQLPANAPLMLTVTACVVSAPTIRSAPTECL